MLKVKVDSLTRENLFSGTILIGIDSSIIFQYSNGFADRNPNVKLKNDNKYQIASLTKQFTATLILKLCEQKLLDLSMPFGEILKWYPNSYKDSITIHQLLSHQSGIINYTNLPNWPEWFSKKYNNRDFVDLFAKASLEFKPGTNFSYSNSNYYILGLVAEELTGISYDKLLKNYFFDPMKMHNSSTLLNYNNIESSVAKGFERLPNGYIEKAPLQDYSTSFSVSGIYSTAEDLFSWTNGFFNNSILTDTTKELMIKPNLNAYGYGFVISQVNSNEVSKIFSNPFTNFYSNKGDEKLKIIWHWGSNPGYNSLIARIANNNFTLIILENITQLKSDKETMIYDLAEEIIKYLAK